MFEYLDGKITIKKMGYVAIDVNGLGYKVFVSLQTLDKIKLDETTRLYIYNHVKEDMFKLIGFAEERERDFFEILINVNGIGMSLALAILSTFNINDLKQIIANEDIKLLTKVPKLGSKKSQKLIVDVKDKMKNLQLVDNVDNGNSSLKVQLEEDIYLALGSLGYSKKDIDKFITPKDLDSYDSIEMAIKDILKKISK
ncbi:MAG TPA: Holliday junction branch migration protein RuvA [Fusobacteriaceae bacterium]|nr:Holliday junction branch migration protein RuvA [Fusobacteriaceae bacterium]